MRSGCSSRSPTRLTRRTSAGSCTATSSRRTSWSTSAATATSPTSGSRGGSADQATAGGAGRSLGTVDYVAPEQIRGEELDGRADLYSLGCLLYECLAGRPPFVRGSDTAVVFAHLEEEPPGCRALEPVIRKALAKEPDDRYQSGRELVAAARDALQAERGRGAAALSPRRSVLVAAGGRDRRRSRHARHATHAARSAVEAADAPAEGERPNLIDARTRATSVASIPARTTRRDRRRVPRPLRVAVDPASESRLLRVDLATRKVTRS